MTGFVITRDGRMFDVDVSFDYGENNRPLPKGEGEVYGWKLVPPDKARTVGDGIPNGWMRARIVATRYFD